MGRKDRGTVDRRLGISTARKLKATAAASSTSAPAPAVRFARDYEPTPPEIFDEMVAAVPFPVETARFVDLGAGKGRVLCLAALQPFREVLGVELFEPLAQLARSNLAALDPQLVRTRKASCTTGDASSFVFPPGPKVVFMFNPFGPPILRRVLANLGQERDEGGGPPVALLYYEPAHAPHVDALPWLERAVESRHWTSWLSPEAARLR